MELKVKRTNDFSYHLLAAASSICDNTSYQTCLRHESFVMPLFSYSRTKTNKKELFTAICKWRFLYLRSS